jgi:hypothetical protein
MKVTTNDAGGARDEYLAGAVDIEKVIVTVRRDDQRILGP